MKDLQRTAAVMLILVWVSNAPAQDDPDETRVRRNQVKIAVQEICPITGNPLGQHGEPVLVKVGREHVFVCCHSCLKSGKVNPEHWATIHANFARAQRICPIMKKPLPANARWTIVEGQVYFVCCPPCIEKIDADPETYLKELDVLYTAALQERRVRR